MKKHQSRSGAFVPSRRSVAGRLLAIFTPILTLAATACSTSQDDAQVSDESEPTDATDATAGGAPTITRVHALQLTFSRWVDVIQLDAATKKVEASCQFIQPNVDDRSTLWKPLQVFWVVSSSQDNVLNGSEIRDVFFSGEVVTPAHYASATQPSPLGFKYLTDTNLRFVTLQDVTISPAGDQIDATIGSPVNAKIRTVAALNDSGACVTKSSYCPTTGDCSQAPAYSPLASIHIEQNMLNMPRNVVFNPPTAP